MRDFYDACQPDNAICHNYMVVRPSFPTAHWVHKPSQLHVLLSRLCRRCLEPVTSLTNKSRLSPALVIMTGRLQSSIHVSNPRHPATAEDVLCHSAAFAMQMKGVFKELEGSMGQLLSGKRAGVVAALVAAAHRTGACQESVCSGLAKALRDNKGESQAQVPVLAVIFWLLCRGGLLTLRVCCQLGLIWEK